MPWLGRKKLAFIPVHRPNASPPDNPVPIDWADDILRRVYYDLDNAGRDQSLRTYIRAISNGHADLDATVLPMQVIDEQDVPPDALEATMGSQLRNQGFDGAALVMLGGLGAGTAQLGGFWCRFVMLEKVGVWAMEFIHALANFSDLYPFQGYSDYAHGDLGPYDEMSCSCGTHPTAYTKAGLGWMDASTIALHSGTARSYDLHAIGLGPPPTGRFAAVRIGAQVPYMLVEARQRVDQFDAGIPAEGVIVYRVQTSNVLGYGEGKMPVFLLTGTPGQTRDTPKPISPGQTFTGDAGVKIGVTEAIPGGYRIEVSGYADPRCSLLLQQIAGLREAINDETDINRKKAMLQELGSLTRQAGVLGCH